MQHQARAVRLGLVAAVAIGVAVAFGATRLGATSAPSGLSKVSNHGSPAALEASAHDSLRTARQRGLARGRAWFLGTVGAESIYHIENGNQGSCYAIGAPLSNSVGSVLCGTSFPSPDHPVVVSIVTPTTSAGASAVVTAVGVAADAVTAVAFTGPNGRIVAKTAVEDNLFAIAASSKRATAFRAFDASGRLVHSTPLR